MLQLVIRPKRYENNKKCVSNMCCINIWQTQMKHVDKRLSLTAISTYIKAVELWNSLVLHSSSKLFSCWGTKCWNCIDLLKGNYFLWKSNFLFLLKTTIYVYRTVDSSNTGSWVLIFLLHNFLPERSSLIWNWWLICSLKFFKFQMMGHSWSFLLSVNG